MFNPIQQFLEECDNINDALKTIFPSSHVFDEHGSYLLEHYIDLLEKTSVESTEISEGIVLDYDDEGKLVGIDIDNASSKVKLKELIINRLPSESKKIMI